MSAYCPPVTKWHAASTGYQAGHAAADDGGVRASCHFSRDKQWRRLDSPGCLTAAIHRTVICHPSRRPACFPRRRHPFFFPSLNFFPAPSSLRVRCTRCPCLNYIGCAKRWSRCIWMSASLKRLSHVCITFGVDLRLLQRCWYWTQRLNLLYQLHNKTAGAAMYQ